MSAWRIAVKSLHALGGGPLPTRAVDVNAKGLARARTLGLVWHINRTHWQLTARGRAWAEGRIVDLEKRTRKMGRGGTTFTATWLTALPRPNAIRLTANVPVEYPA